MKRLFLFLSLIALSLTGGVRTNRTITVASGTPVRLSSTHIYASKVFIQMAKGGTSLGYVMAGIPDGTTPSSSTSAHVTAQLAPASSTAPGGAYSDSDDAGIDISLIWVDGDHTGDTIVVSYDKKN